MNYFRRIRDIAFSIGLLVIPFFFLRTHLAEPAEHSVVDSLVLKMSAPIQYVATEAARGVSNVLEEYVYLVDVKRDNDRLRMENARLREEHRELRIQARENRRLRELMQLRSRLGGDTISAQVISKDISHVFRVVRVAIDRGERDLVRPGMPVVSSEGLVGQVRSTTSRQADVLLTVDRSSAIDIVIPRSGARGMLVGMGEEDGYVCRIQYLRREDELQVGDEVYTSGLGQRFPASILVGRVSSIERLDFGLYQEAVVTPAVNFANVEEVLILTRGSREQSLRDGILEFGEDD